MTNGDLVQAAFREVEVAGDVEVGEEPVVADHHERPPVGPQRADQLGDATQVEVARRSTPFEAAQAGLDHLTSVTY